LNARNFRNPKGMPYTRRGYMKGIPGSKIVKFTMGNTSKEFPVKVELINLQLGQVRHNSLEAARIAANRLLELRLGGDNYFMKVVPFPHIVLREHKRVNVAQADRFQEGMKSPYGKPTGTAARVNRGDPLIVVEVEKDGVETAKEALERAAAKFPLPSRVFVRE
jgi:large subunit ribosomal protein L10e